MGKRALLSREKKNEKMLDDDSKTFYKDSTSDKFRGSSYYRACIHTKDLELRLYHNSSVISKNGNL